MKEDEVKDSNENFLENIKNNKKNFFSKMTEEETIDWFNKLNLEKNVLNEILKIVKNGKDLISLYNNTQLLEKLNLDLHNINIINDAIEEALEEQLKINIEIEKDKNIVLNIENEPKYKLREVIIYLEKLFKKKIFLSPKSNPNEILNPNTLIHKKILLNPNKYCNLCLFNENIIPKPETKNNTTNPIKTTTPNINTNTNTNINIPELINDKKDTNKGGYTSLFQNKKKNLIADFNTDYQMPSLNNNKLNEVNKNINNINNNNDFKYQNLLLNKEKENKFKLDFDISNNNTSNNNTEQKKGFPNFNLINNTDSSINKNYFTQRNFNTKNFSLNENNANNKINNNNNNDNGDIFSKMTNLKIIDRTKNINANNPNLEKNNLDNINNTNANNKTENRYEFVKYQDLDIFKSNSNNNTNNTNKNLEVNDINNLIIKTQTPNLNNNNNKLNNFQIMNNNKDDSDDILKSLREKYSLQNNGSEFKDMNNNLDYKKDYKPKTPVAEGRRTFNNDNMKFNIGEDNSNEPLENKFLNINQNRTNKNDNGDKYSFLNKNKINMFNINEEQESQNNNNFGGMQKIRNNNRPSPGLDFNNFQYKAIGYKTPFGQSTENEEQDDLNEDMNNI